MTFFVALLPLEQVFQALFNQEYERLCRLAYSYLSDTHLAEDVVQDTFIRIWEQKRDLIGDPNIRFYLSVAVKNNCITVLRKQKKSPVIFVEERHPDIPFVQEDAAQVHSDQQRRIGDALQKLPPKCREVFLLVKMHEMSYKQTAELLDISVKTVENQMGKALRIFREGLSRAGATLLFFVSILY